MVRLGLEGQDGRGALLYPAPPVGSGISIERSRQRDWLPDEGNEAFYTTQLQERQGPMQKMSLV